MKGRKKILATAAVILTVIASCSVENNRKALSFFFDGVPQADTMSVMEDNVNRKMNTGAITGDSSMAIVVPVLTLHYPYEEKECMSCHDENSPGAMVLQEPDLCYMCHDDFTNVYEVVHDALLAGFCTYCHHPHQSRNDYLLKLTDQGLCTQCHDLEEVLKNEMHTDLGDTECTLCHNPHGGSDKYLIR